MKHKPYLQNFRSFSSISADFLQYFPFRYNLDSSCHNKLDIDSVSGKVTLKTELDYDGDNAEREIHCKVYAKDVNGTELQNFSDIIINVIDVVDYPPTMDVSA